MKPYPVWAKTTYPITIIVDRYSGIYSGGYYLAFNLEAENIPSDVYANDSACGAFWDLEQRGLLNIDVGKGKDCNEALFDLYTKMQNKTIMTNTVNWLWQFDESKDKFQWVFIQYGFDGEWNRLLEARKKNQIKKMKDIMQSTWNDIPESVFSAEKNPTGFAEFVALLED